MKNIDLIKPNVYDRFQCKGGACRRTCCAGWKITVGKSEYQDLKDKLNRETKILRRLAEKERSAQVYGEFVLDGKKGCPLQSDQGLCGLQLSLGPEALPSVCTFFPRRALRCGDEMQLSLTPACERVLELLLEQDDHLSFIRRKEPLPGIPAVQIYPEHRAPVWNHYIQLQEFCLLLLQAEDVSLDHRMALLGLGLHEVNTYYENKKQHKIAGYIESYLSALSQTEDASSLLPSKGFEPIMLIGTFLSSSARSDGYRELKEKVKSELQIFSQIDTETEKATLSYSIEVYEQHRTLFQKFTDAHPYFLENVMAILFTVGQWCAMPRVSYSIWDQYMYACWVYSNLKFVLTACITEDAKAEDLLDICVVLFRSWIHNEGTMKAAIQNFHDTKSDTLAHMAMLVQAG